MRAIVALTCLAALLCAAPRAAAQQPQAAQAVAVAEAGPLTPAKLALARRFLNAIGFDLMLDRALAANVPDLIAEVQNDSYPMTPHQQEELARIIQSVMRGQMIPKVMLDLEPVYARAFTEAELQAAVDFYESPAGHAITARSPVLAQQATPLTAAAVPAAKAEIRRLICARYACDLPGRVRPRTY